MRVRAVRELQTERLRLRQWRPADELPMMEINRDPEVARYLNRTMDAAAARAFLVEADAHWDRHGFGIYALERREPDGVLLGFVGLAFPGYLPAVAHRPELGWRLRRSAWGSGYATEAAVAVRDHAVDDLGLRDDLVSIIHPDNDRSRRVATKLGMAVEHLEFNPRLQRDVEVWSFSAREGSAAPRASG
jgi:RimJ/RimL family protein N-acetyltransferase